MRYRIVFRTVTELSNQWATKQWEHNKGADDVHQVIVDASNEHHALQIFMNIIQQYGLKIISYRIEPAFQANANDK